jgi:hypothetical protein
MIRNHGSLETAIREAVDVLRNEFYSSIRAPSIGIARQFLSNPTMELFSTTDTHLPTQLVAVIIYARPRADLLAGV